MIPENAVLAFDETTKKKFPRISLEYIFTIL